MSITRPGLAKPVGVAGSSALTEGVELVAELGRAGAASADGARGRLER